MLKALPRWVGVLIQTIAAAVVLTVVVAWLSGVFKHKVSPGRQAIIDALPAPGITPAAVAVRQVTDVSPTVGTVRAVQETTVSSRLLARVQKVNVTAGMLVQQGDVLIELAREDIDAQIRQAGANVDAAKARLGQAKSDLEKIEQMARSSAAAPRELASAKRAAEVAAADLAAGEHGLEQLKTQIDYATIRATMSGIVVDKQVDVGDLAQPGKTLVTLYDPQRLQLVASVPERLAVTLAVGDLLGVELDALNLQCQAKVQEIVPEAQPGSRSMLVKVTGPCPPGVVTGMFGRLLVPRGMRSQLVVPASAVRRVGQLDMVQIVEQHQGKRPVQQRYVRTGRVDGDVIEILSGVAEGEFVNADFGKARP